MEKCKAPDQPATAKQTGQYSTKNLLQCLLKSTETLTLLEGEFDKCPMEADQEEMKCGSQHFFSENAFTKCGVEAAEYKDTEDKIHQWI